MSAIRLNGDPYFMFDVDPEVQFNGEVRKMLTFPEDLFQEVFEAEELETWEEDPDAAIESLQSQMELVSAQIDEACEVQKEKSVPWVARGMNHEPCMTQEQFIEETTALYENINAEMEKIFAGMIERIENGEDPYISLDYHSTTHYQRRFGKPTKRPKRPTTAKKKKSCC
jgi:hypothetical protein